MTHEELIKQTILELAREHKATCAKADCGVQLYHLRELLALAGIILSPDEATVLL